MKIEGELPTREEFLKVLWKQIDKKPNGTLLKIYAEVSGLCFKRPKVVPKNPIAEMGEGLDLQEFDDVMVDSEEEVAA